MEGERTVESKRAEREEGRWWEGGGREMKKRKVSSTFLSSFIQGSSKGASSSLFATMSYRGRWSRAKRKSERAQRKEGCYGWILVEPFHHLPPSLAPILDSSSSSCYPSTRLP